MGIKDDYIRTDIVVCFILIALSGGVLVAALLANDSIQNARTDAVREAKQSVILSKFDKNKTFNLFTIYSMEYCQMHGDYVSYCEKTNKTAYIIFGSD